MSSTAIRAELKSARSRAIVSVVLNIFLMVIKGIAGVKADSSALLGDAIHSGTDVFAAAAAFLGLWLAGREHPSFPYGLYKAETIATLVSAVAVLVAGYEIARQALVGPERLPDVAIALPVTVFCLAAALIFGFVQMRAGERLNSPALKADARDYLADSLSTAVVLVGLVATSLGWPLDRWAAAAVSLFVFRSGGGLLLMAVKDLLDGAIDRETEREIIQMVEAYPRVTRVRKCLSRTAGGRFIVDMDVIMHTPSHKLAGQLADRLEEDIPARFPRVIMARVRPHYSSGEVVKRVVPVTGPGGELSGHLGSAAWFLLETIDKKSGKIIREYVENPYAKEKKKKGLLVGRWLLSLKPDLLAVPESAGKDGVAVVLLREAGVEIVPATNDNFKTEEASLSRQGD
ncbi:MAG: cation diffusion facilitator family transporter [Desulfobulbaceae bacterium DB1]|nr:MAG: cation diffusion facilitator family transporter [Desulfobulbaceae bacterium DB1]